MSELEKAQGALKRLLDLREVSRVVCVDDEYLRPVSVGEIIGLCTKVSIEVCSEILELPSSFFEVALDVWELNLSNHWDDLDEQTQRRIYRELQFRANDAVSIDDVIIMCQKVGPDVCETLPQLSDIPFRNAEDWQSPLRTKWEVADSEWRRGAYRELQFRDRDDERVDAVAAGTLAALLEGYELLELTPSEWDAQKDSLIEDAKTRSTLFLFDHDLHKAGKRTDEGIWIIKSVVEAADRPIICGLLSHTFSQEQSYDIWYELADSVNISRDHFLPLSKRLLHGDFAIFARMVKLTLLNEPCARLKDDMNQKISDAQAQARDDVGKINIYDFEHIVFRASRREGVWEPDTLFRIFSLFHRSATLKLAREDGELHELATKIRRISQINTESPEAPQRMSWKIKHLELYDSGEYINSLHMATELGDIYKKDGGRKQFILLGQPCDLMVRGTGKRKHTIKEAMLARIVDKLPTDDNGIPQNSDDYYELPYFDESDGMSRYVSFREAQAVRLSVLDMCCYNTDGRAKLRANSECPKNVIPTWEKHHAELCHYVAETIQKYRTYSDQRIPEEVLKLTIPQSSNEKLFAGEINLRENTLTYKCRRVKRLRQPDATAMLSRFATYMARAALEMDFGKEWAEDEGTEDVA